MKSMDILGSRRLAGGLEVFRISPILLALLLTSPALLPEMPLPKKVRILDPCSFESLELGIDPCSLKPLAASNPCTLDVLEASAGLESSIYWRIAGVIPHARA